MLQVRMAAVVAALTLALVGCSDDDPEPAPAPSPTSPSSESSHSPTPTSEPPEPVTATEAVRDWVRERNHALTSGDTDALRGLTAEGCGSCEPYIDLIEDVYAAGGRYETEGWTVDTAKELKPLEVTAAITMGGGVMIAAAGEPADEYAEDKALFRFRVEPVRDRLVVSFVGLIR